MSGKGDNMINQVHEYVKGKLDSESTGHDYMHALRVSKNALEISYNLEADLNLIEVASLTHDLIDKKVFDDPQKEHDLLTVFLQGLYNENFVKKVFSIIENISFSEKNVPESIEGKIVQDADRLDALGAIGIARTFAYGGKNNRNIYHPDKKDDSLTHFYDKLFSLSSLMNTETGRELARDRTAFMHEFIFRLLDEVE